MLVILLLPTIGYFLLESKQFQLFVANKLLLELSSELGIDVSVGDVSVDFFNNISIKSLLLKDHDKDTLLFIDSFVADIDSFSVKNKNIAFKHLDISKFDLRIKQYADGKVNYQFVLDSLGRKQTTDGSIDEGWHITLGEILWDKSNIIFDNRTPNKNRLFSLRKNLILSAFKGRLQINTTEKDSISAELTELSFVERSGLQVKELKGLFSFSPSNMGISKLIFRTNNSKIDVEDVVINGDSLIYSLKYFAKAKANLNVEKSSISFKDLNSLFPKIPYSNDWVTMSGGIDGTIDNLFLSDVTITSGEMLDSHFSGTINGLPDWKSSYFNVNASRIYVNVDELKLFVERSSIVHNLDNNLLNNLYFIQFDGSLSGYIDNMVAFGHVASNLGELNTDMAIENSSQKDTLQFKGKLSTPYFDLGRLLDNNHLGKVSLNIGVDGSKVVGRPLVSSMNGKIDRLEVNGYTYNNIDVNGVLGDRRFNGNLNLKDANGIFKMQGKFDLSKKIPEFDFWAYGFQMDLQKMNLIEKCPAKVGFEAEAKFIGSTLDNLTGEASVKHLQFRRSGRELIVDSFKVVVFANDDVRHIVLSSDYINGTLEGSYNIKSLISNYNVFLPNAYQSLFPEKDSTIISKPNNFKFNILVQDYSELGEILDLPLVVSDSTEISGTIDEANRFIDLSASASKMNYKTVQIENLKFDVGSSANSSLLKTHISCDRVGDNTTGFSDLLIKLDAENDSIDYLVSWKNAAKRDNSGFLNGTLGFISGSSLDQSSFELRSKPSHLIINDSLWSMPRFSMAIAKDLISIDSFKVVHQNEYLRVDGRAGKAYTDSVRIKASGVDLAYLMQFVNIRQLTVDGILGGNAVVLNALDRPIAMADFTIDTLVVNGFSQGDINIKTTWDERGKLLAIRSVLTKGTIQPLKVTGIYSPEENTINLSMDLRKFRIEFLQKYLNSAVQNIRGMTTGHLDLKGAANHPYLQGFVFAQNAFLDIDYLKTTYSFTDTVYFEKTRMFFDDISLRDFEGNTGVFAGEIRHDGFSNFKYDLTADVTNMNVLRTSPKDNKLFYGTAYGTGQMHITGASSRVFLDINVKTAENTKIYIPLSQDETAGEYSFIKFVDKDSVVDRSSFKIEQPSGLAMNLEVEATPDAEVQLIFNSKMGDIVKGVGAGNLNFNYGYDRVFKMFGEYKIQRGTYSFILRNVINKKFDISEGSLVTWSGDPYGAVIDLDAYYRTKASLYELMGDALSEDKRANRVPVDCHMMLSGNLMSPAVKFGIDLPTSNEETQSRVDNIINSEEEMSRQVISLLVINSFYTPDQLRSAGTIDQTNQSNAAWVTTSELLSNQLSHWLSQISQSFDVGFNYRPGTQITSDEVELALSTQIFDNRLKINGNVGYRQEQQTTSNFIGDFDVDLRLNKSGTVLLKAYTHANDDILNETSPTTQGMGIVYREDFETVNDLKNKYIRLIKKLFKRNK